MTVNQIIRIILILGMCCGLGKAIRYALFMIPTRIINNPLVLGILLFGLYVLATRIVHPVKYESIIIIVALILQEIMGVFAWIVSLAEDR